MTTETVLIIGAGQAGAEAAWRLRELGHEGAVILAGAESHAPYERPPLSKKFLSGTGDTARLQLRKPTAYTEAGIDLLTGTAVRDLDTEAGTATTANGARIDFDHCILALGATPRHLPQSVPGGRAARVLRDLDDAAELRETLQAGRRLVVIGGGYLGMEVAATARGRDVAVSVVEAAPAIMNRGVSQQTAAFFHAAHEARCVAVKTGVAVASIRPGKGGDLLTLDSGEELEAGIVIAAIGVAPNTALAAAAGIDCDDGILVDGNCRTSVPGVYAIGDCAAQLVPSSGRRLRLESVQGAVTHARLAAAAITGTDPPPERAPYFWTEQYSYRLQMAGLADPSRPCEDLLRGSPEDGSFTVYRFQDDVLAAVEAVNNPVDFVRSQGRIGQSRETFE